MPKAFFVVRASIADPARRAALDRAVNSAAMKALVAEFDRAWPGIPRSREAFTLVEERDGA